MPFLLEGLHEALTRTDRAIARSREQTSALRAEASRSTTSDSRRHAAQIAAMVKAIGREKQRRLAARALVERRVCLQDASKYEWF